MNDLEVGWKINSIIVDFKQPAAQVYNQSSVEYCLSHNAVNLKI
jgi:hypothetical protein